METQEILSYDYWNQVLINILEWTVNELPSLLLLIILLVVLLRILSVSIKRLKNVFVKRASKSQKHDTVEEIKRINTFADILKGTGKVIIWAVFLATFLKKIGIDIGPILAGAGIAGLAIGFGAQELVRDFISGFFILSENLVRTGDYAVINGTLGLIEKIELRTMTLRDFSGVVHVFQNGKINSLANVTKEWSAMIFEIGVAYKEDVDQVIKIMQETGEEMFNDPACKDKLLENLEIFGLDKFADSAVIIRARLKTKPGEHWDMGREYRKRLKKAFDTKGIEIPFPHTTVYWGEKINPLELNVRK